MKRKYATTTHIWMTPAEIDRIATKMFGENWRKPFCAFFEISYPQLHRIMGLEPGRGIPKSAAIALRMIDAHGKPEMTATAIADAEAVKRDPSGVNFKLDKTAPDAGLDFGDESDESAAETVPAAISEAKEAIAAASAKPARKPAKKATAKPAKAAAAKAKAPAKKPAKTPAKKKPVAA